MNRKEFFKVSAAASLASLLSPLSAYAEKFESEGKKVKVAVIGCGSVSTQYFPHISKCPYVEIVACCDIKPDRAQKAAKQYIVLKRLPSNIIYLNGTSISMICLVVPSST